MAILTQEAKAALKHAPVKAVKGTGHQIKKHPVIAAGTGGYVAGGYVQHKASLVHSNPEFYDSTPNKGRSENRHPLAVRSDSIVGRF